MQISRTAKIETFTSAAWKRLGTRKPNGWPALLIVAGLTHSLAQAGERDITAFQEQANARISNSNRLPTH